MRLVQVLITAGKPDLAYALDSLIITLVAGFVLDTLITTFRPKLLGITHRVPPGATLAHLIDGLAAGCAFFANFASHLH